MASTQPSAPKSDPKDPRFRPYRMAMYSLYIAGCAVFSVLVVTSTVRSIQNMTPPKLKSTDTPLPVQECVQGAGRLWERLEQERAALTSHHPAKTADDKWSQFRVEWLRQLRQLDGSCGTDLPERQTLQKLLSRLEQVQDLYTTHAVQYAGEVGSSVDALHQALEDARKQWPANAAAPVTR